MLPDPVPGTSVRAVLTCPDGGRCMMAGFPGLITAPDRPDRIDPARTAATLAAMHARGAPLLVVLAEAADLPPDAFPTLRDTADSIGIDLAFLPIRDYHAPDDDTYRAWRDLRASRTDLPGHGGSIAVTCRHGAGRSGLMAALVLIEGGMSLDAAVATVRDHFAEAIETEVQMRWLARVSARLKDESVSLDVDSGATHS